MTVTQQTAHHQDDRRHAGAFPGPVFAAEQLRTVAGQRVDLEVYGKLLKGVVLRPGRGSAVIDVDSSSQVRRLRLGVKVHASFATPEGAAEVDATLGQAHDGIVLRFVGEAKLINRRRYPRAAITVPAQLAWRETGRLAIRTAAVVTVNLSAGGAMLELTGPGARPVITAGTLALVALDLPGHAMDLPARVLEQFGSRLRVQFAGPADSDVATLGQLITHHHLDSPAGQG